MKFLLQVRRDKIPGPLRRKFDKEQWKVEFDKSAEDDRDRGIYEAGLLVDAKANELRALVRFVYDKAHSATTKARALVAVSNVLAVDIEKQTYKQLGNAEQVITQFDFLGIRLELPMGAKFSPDEIVQGLVDGCEIPIRVALEDSAFLGGVPKFSRVNWSDVWSDINLGILYRHIEDVWDDCLWNDYRPSMDSADVIRFVPHEIEWVRRLRASQQRYASLAWGLLLNVRQLVYVDEEPALVKLATTRTVKSVKKEGRRQTLVFESAKSKDADNKDVAVTRAFAFDSAFPDLLQETHTLLAGATLDHLLSAWIVVRQLAQVLREPMHHIDRTKRPIHAWIADFAPIIQRGTLVDALCKELAVNAAQAAKIVEFLTYRGKASQELWAQPLVPASEESIMLSFAALTAEPNRLVDVWSRQLGVDLARRGPSFETDMRTELARQIRDAEIAKIAAVLPDAFVFKPPSGRKEEMDLILRIGSVIVVGELKCILRPTETKGYAEHRNVLTAAAAQIRRKVRSAETHLEHFCQQLRAQGMAVPDEVQILPMVLTNSAIHAGFPIDGVPIADRHIVEVLIRGYYTDNVVEHGRRMRDVRKHRIYATASDAPQAIADYLAAPRQMGLYIGGLRERWVPVAKLGDADRPWLISTYESIPKVGRD